MHISSRNIAVLSTGSTLENLGHTDNATTRGTDGEIIGSYAFRGSDATGGPNGGVRYAVESGETYRIVGDVVPYDGATPGVSGTILRLYDTFSNFHTILSAGSFDVEQTFSTTVLDLLCTTPPAGFRCNNFQLYKIS